MAKKKASNLYNFKDKERNIDTYLEYLINRTCQMFHYEGLPEGIDPIMLEKRLQTRGCLVLTKIKSSDIQKVSGPDDIEIPEGIYAFEAGPAGVMDFNGNQVFAVIAHPRLNKSLTVKFGEDAVLLRNDTHLMGLLPLFKRYATQLVENDITMNMANIESRILSLIVAGDSNSINSAKTFLDDIEKGSMGIIADKGFNELFKLQTLPYTTTANNSLTNLIEYQQYVKASLYNELGLSANYNMKRESINSNEAQMGQESLLPLVDDMLNWRKAALDQLNELYGTNASVEFASGWTNLHEQLIEGELELEEPEISEGNSNKEEAPEEEKVEEEETKEEEPRQDMTKDKAESVVRNEAKKEAR